MPVLLASECTEFRWPSAAREEAAKSRTCLRKVSFAGSVTFVLAGLILYVAMTPSNQDRRGGVVSAIALPAESLEAWERLNHLLVDANVSERALEDAPVSRRDKQLYHTQCSVDVVQATAYLGQGVVWLDKAVTYEGTQCPDKTQRGCAVAVEAVITSLFWVMSYLSLTASSCAASINAQAACAADVTGVAADLGELSLASTLAADDCYFGPVKRDKDDEDKEEDDKEEDDEEEDDEEKSRRLGGSGFLSVLIPAVKAKQQEQRDRNLDIALCTFDAVQSASYVIRAVNQIVGAADAGCDDPKVCSINVLNIVSSFAWISQFVALAVADCSTKDQQRAFCTGDISDLVAATASLVATSASLEVDCNAEEMPEAEEIEEITETKR